MRIQHTFGDPLAGVIIQNYNYLNLKLNYLHIHHTAPKVAQCSLEMLTHEIEHLNHHLDRMLTLVRFLACLVFQPVLLEPLEVIQLRDEAAALSFEREQQTRSIHSHCLPH